MAEKRVYVVPHSHWDREWYFTIEDSNLLLAENLDHLIDLLETNEDYHGYIFDGQISIVDEYLKVRPQNAERLRALVEAKRIFVGPWYTQADSLLVHKESLVRNLLYGVKGAEAMGHSMNIGYLPDIFGQNQYLPSLFKGFGIEYSILQRGIYLDQLDENLNFTWQSPDGEHVKANLLELGYGPGKFLSAEEEFHKERLQPMLDSLSELNRDTDHLLLPSGGDQVLVRSHFPETIERLNEQDDRYEYILSDYETFMEDTWDRQDFDHTVEGELIATEGSRIHNTIASQRYDIKKWNHIVERKIINQLEPLAVIGSTLGLKYPQAWLDEMWKNLFDVHAHDSIGGCNSDDTNRDIVQRLVKIDRQADGLMNLLKRQMTSAVRERLEQEDIFLVFNTAAKKYQTSVKTVLFTREKDFYVRTLEDGLVNFSIIDQEYLSGGKKIVVTADGDQEVEVPGYYRTEILLETMEVPPLGYLTLQIDEKEAAMDALEETKKNHIENDRFRVECTDGKLLLREKGSDLVVENLIQFEDTGDAGDSYDYSPLPGSGSIITEAAKLKDVYTSALVEKMVVEHSVTLPADLGARREGRHDETLTIETELELRNGESFVRVQHEIDNRVDDHRVRVLIQTPVERPDSSFADQGYSLIERATENPRMDVWQEQGYKEAPVPIYKVEQFAGVQGEEGTFAAHTKGLKEYEVLKEEGRFALTLFRSVGLLGRDDLLWRPGRASGINNKVVRTPDAQMHGKMTFEYAIQMSSNQVEVSELFATADLFQERYVTYQNQSLNTFEERLDRFEVPLPLKGLPSSYSLASLESDTVFTSSIKKAHGGDGYVMRLFNPEDTKAVFELKGEGLTDLQSVNLAEEVVPVEPFEVAAKSFQTIRVSTQGGTNA
ncbi:glycoside hydrolase family 38 C-terminal domain-containing protein [Halobacillus litoralis]|uniref:Alpha-mannosidase n=1 Tax=Halobacillus litoralis TaxID=45668 RepID=A0A410MFS3_9BACI|nr:glycoside hydrolase family 38 C-terminal domain-containing protein [Halobacillus litoralis]QAS53569.1 alpha-mannosidase [Halobacillus litoralis]